MCPICRTPFHEPITTKRCGHTFCTECLRQAIELQPCCPIDRRPIAFHPDQLCNPRIVGHQLDRLKVRCPNAGCEVVTTRGSIKTHYDRDCPQTHVLCPGPGCNKGVARCDFDTCVYGGPLCLHEKLNCRYCTKKIVFTDREKHYETECEGHTTACADCSALVVRHRMQKHLATQCPEAQTVCMFKSHGCSVAGKRSVVEAHEQGGCVYEAIGKLVKDRAEDRTIINNLRSRLTAMETFRASNSNRYHSRSPHGPSSIPDLDLSDTTRTTPQTLFPNDAGHALEESPEDYMLAQFERMEAKMEDLRKSVTELDGRHSMMLLNETMPLKDAITELRSNLGVISMHTTWLMNVQRQNRMAAGGGGGGGASGQGQRTGASGGGGGAGGTGSGSGSGSGAGSVRGDGDGGREGERRVNVTPRRMSGENPPRL
ncbi:putative ubiquitin fusion degradation protein [Coniochaeta sp. 2T2.1]|nr:putative ubiquitin fusion degradation protein [Coniochaeta sp. 2T2.1]